MIPIKFYQNALEYSDERFKRTFESETEYLVKHIVRMAEETRSLIKVLDVGCGNGRTMHNLDRELSKNHPNVMFYLTGIDSNPEKLKVAKEMPQARFVLGNIITDTTLRRDNYDLVYSSYNTIGCVQDGTLKDFVGRMVELTADNGVITNITWNRSGPTTEFLKDYYKAIGFEAVKVSTGRSVCIDPEDKKEYRFERVNILDIGDAYRNSGLTRRIFSLDNIGDLWVAVGVRK